MGAEGKIGINKYNIGLKVETYSTTEYNFGVYVNLSYNVEGSLGVKEGEGFISTLNDFKPKIDVQGYVYGNTLSGQSSTGVLNETYMQAGGNAGPVKLTIDSKGNIKVGVGIGTGSSGKISIINKTTILDYKSDLAK
jgi:hypothetical protein